MFLVVLGVLFLFFILGTGCEHSSVDKVRQGDPKIDKDDRDDRLVHEYSTQLVYYEVVDDMNVRHLYVLPQSLQNFFCKSWSGHGQRISILRLDTRAEVTGWLEKQGVLQGHLKCVHIVENIGYVSNQEWQEDYLLKDFIVL